MSRMSTKSLALIALLLATTTAIAQVPVLKKPVLAPQVKPAIPPAMLKMPITVVNAASIASNSPSPEEAARRLKAQNVPVAAAVAALRSAFPQTYSTRNLSGLRAAGYTTPDLMVTLKQADSLSAASMVRVMAGSGIPAVEWTPSMPQLYTLDFDALLADLRSVPSERQWFGYALDAMNYNVPQMVQTGYRYFSGGFPNRGNYGAPYPGAGDMYDLLKLLNPLAQHVQVDHHALWTMMMNAGYSPGLMMAEVRIGIYDPGNNQALDPIARCMAQTNLVRDNRSGHLNPPVKIQIAPDGNASHSDAERGCYVQFLDALRREGVTRAVAVQLADDSVQCLPQSNPACPALLAEVAERMVTEARYPPEKN